MRVLLLNPNTSAGLTGLMATHARRAAGPGVDIRAVTARRGFPYISNRAEAQVAGAILLETLAQEAGDVNAAIVAAFGDPGLQAARELFPFPVIGTSEAAVLSASMLGRRFGIVGFTRRMRAWYEDSVHEIGMERRFSGFRAPGKAPESPATAQKDLEEELNACVRLCHEQDGADVVIIAGAPLTGFAARAAAHAPVPLIDPVAAAVRQAAAVTGLAAQGAPAGRGRDDPKPTTGLDAALAARFLGAEPELPDSAVRRDGAGTAMAPR